MKIVIFCGGRGTRLWPVSRVSKPKPFIPLVDGKSFFEITYNRYRKKYSANEIFVSTEDKFVRFVKKQAPEIPSNNIIAEPERKDLLAACGLATAIVNKYYPKETIHIAWAKNIMARESVFLDVLESAGKYAEKSGLIMSVDAKPPFASVHHGWVKLGKALGNINGYKVMQIEKHIEKPKEAKAQKIFKSGDWLINTGYRIWKADQMLAYYKKYQPAMHEGLEKIANTWGTKKQDGVLKGEYHKFKKESIEFGIFEKLPGNVRATIAADMGWEDIGISWQLFYESLITPKNKTVIKGGVLAEFINSENNLVFGPQGKMIAVIGLNNIAVIDTKDGLVVCKMDQTQKIKVLWKKLEQYHKDYIK